MQPSPLSASTSMPPSAAGFSPSRPTGDLAYQTMTIAAVLMLLLTLWVF